MGNYNNTIKSKFIDDAHIRHDRRLYNAYALLFEAVSTLEKRYDKDIAEFNNTQLINLSDDAEAGKLVQTMKYRSALLRYFDWYNNNVSKIPAAMGWMLDSFQSYKASMVSSPVQLKRALDAAFDKAEEQTIDVVYRAYFWIAFAGLREKRRAANMTVADIDMEAMEIHFDNQTYPIYSEGAADLRAAKELTKFVFNHANYSTKQPRFAGDKILRGIKSNANAENVRREVNKAFKAVAGNKDVKNLSYRTALHSGMFFRQYQEEAMGADNKVSFQKLIPRTRDGVVQSMDVWRAVRVRADADLKDEYYVWKYLFYKGIV